MNQSPTIELQLRMDADDSQSPFEFYMENEEGETIFEVSFERGYTASQWDMLVCTCTMGIEAVCLPRKNGVHLHTHGKHVIFSMGKNGDKMSISVPKAACVSAFKTAAEVRRWQPGSSGDDDSSDDGSER